MSTRAQTSRPVSSAPAESRAPDDRVVAASAMNVMRLAQAEGRRITALDLAQSLEVRRADVRRVVADLDRRGLVDALRMRLTLLGFAYLQALPHASSVPARRSDAKVLRAA
jgi:hypothetical protein